MNVKPQELLKEYQTRYPGLIKTILHFAEIKGEDLDWSDWCFVPIAASYAAVSGGGSNRINPSQSADVGILCALATWSVSKGIYTFDSDVFEELWNTSLTDDIPEDIFLRLPEYCLYVDTASHEVVISEKKLFGFFVHMEEDQNDFHKELRLVMDWSDGLVPLPLHLTGEGLMQSLHAMSAFTIKSLMNVGAELPDFSFSNIPEYFNLDVIKSILSLVIYICSLNADIASSSGPSLRPQRAKPQSIKKKGLRYFMSDTIRKWDVAYRLGAALRKAKAQYTSSTDGTEEGVSKRPHVRRGHFHTFLTGPRAGEQERIAKWLPPIPVNVDNFDDIIPTERKVKR